MIVPDLTVRAAVAADAAGIARVHVLAWRQAYAHLLPEHILAARTVSERTRRWRSILADEFTSVWVAERDGDVVGWASTSAGRDADAPRGCELEGLYTLASEYGHGAGQALLDAAIADRPAYLWQAADNPRARAFYERNGFRADGESATKPLAGVPVAVIRLTR